MYDLLMNASAISPVQRAEALEGLVRKHADDAEGNRYLSKEVAVAFAKMGCMELAHRWLIPMKSQTQ